MKMKQSTIIYILIGIVLLIIGFLIYKYYNKSTTHCKKKKICIYCIEKEVGPHCKCKICNMN